MAKAKTKHHDKPELPADKFIPIAIDTEANAKAVDEAERVVIFTIDGVDYSMPKAARTEIALRFMDIQEDDADAAAQYLLTETIGQEAIDALKGVKGLTDKQFEGVMTRIQAIALPKGKAPRGAAKH